MNLKLCYNDTECLKGGETMANVMVVDDAVFMRMTIKKMLEAHGHSVIGEAGNGVE